MAETNQGIVKAKNKTEWKKLGFRWPSATMEEFEGCLSLTITPQHYNQGNANESGKKLNKSEQQDFRIYLVQEEGKTQQDEMTEKEVIELIEERKTRVKTFNDLIRESDFKITLAPENISKEFSNLEDLKNYYEIELEFWKYLSKVSYEGGEFARAHKEHVEVILNQINQLCEFRKNNDASQFNSLLVKVKAMAKSSNTNQSRTKSLPFISSQNGFGSFLRTQFNKNPLRASAAIDFIISGFCNTTFMTRGKNEGQNYLSGLIEAYLFKQNEDSPLEEFNVASKENLVELSSQLNDLVSKFKTEKEASEQDVIALKSEFETLKTETDAEFRSFMNDKEDDYKKETEGLKSEIAALQETYRNHLRLKGPAEYWEQQKKGYQKSGLIWMTIAVLVSVTFIGFFSYLMISIDLPLLESNKWTPSSIKGSLLIVSIATAGFYLINLFIKLSLSSYHLRKDAAERLQLSHFYLSLIEKEAVGPEDQNIILQSLFSRSDTGLFKHQDGPSMPVDLNALSRMRGGS